MTDLPHAVLPAHRLLVPRYASPDPDLPLIFTRARAVAAGLTPDQVRQRVRSGAWTTLARGVYRRVDERRLADAPPTDAFAASRLEHAQHAVAQALAHPGSVIAGASAAAVLDVPTISGPPPRVCLLRPGSPSVNHRFADLRGWPVLDSEILHTRPPTTSLARTWFDLARLGDLADALAAGDYLLRELLATPDELTEVAERNQEQRGSHEVRLALTHLNRLRESPLESASWAYFIRHGLPLPRMQVSIRDRAGRFIGRVDFLWDECPSGIRVVGEADGAAKYVGRSDIYAEKRREDELRGEDLRVIRWGHRDLATPVLAHRLAKNIC